MDQIANAVFMFPYKKLNIYIKCILDSDKLIRKNLFVVLKFVALGIDPFKWRTKWFSIFVLFVYVVLGLFYCLVFCFFFIIFCNDFTVNFLTENKENYYYY